MSPAAQQQQVGGRGHTGAPAIGGWTIPAAQQQQVNEPEHWGSPAACQVKAGMVSTAAWHAMRLSGAGVHHLCNFVGAIPMAVQTQCELVSFLSGVDAGPV